LPQYQTVFEREKLQANDARQQQASFLPVLDDIIARLFAELRFGNHGENRRGRAAIE
jgi:hypothetical protein